MQNQYDVIIIGAGAVGCAIARELSFYDLKICVLEKEADVAAGTSGRNSAVVHAGFNNKPGSLMAKLCVAGNEGMEALCRRFGITDERDFRWMCPMKKPGKSWWLLMRKTRRCFRGWWLRESKTAAGAFA